MSNSPLKIDWAKAPKWANYLTIDIDGAVWWHENKPIQGFSTWSSNGQRAFIGFVKGIYDWIESLQQRPLFEWIKPDAALIDEADSLANGNQQPEKPATWQGWYHLDPNNGESKPLPTTHFNTEISGYLAGKNSFITGYVDLLLARMAKEERFGDGDPNDLSLSPVTFDVCKIYYPGIGDHYCIVFNKRDSKRGVVAECLGINPAENEAWRFDIVIGGYLESPESGWIRTITELEAVEFRKAMEVVYG